MWRESETIRGDFRSNRITCAGELVEEMEEGPSVDVCQLARQLGKIRD